MKFYLIIILLAMSTNILSAAQQSSYAQDRIIVRFKKAPFQQETLPAMDSRFFTFMNPAADSLNKIYGCTNARLLGEKGALFVLQFSRKTDIKAAVNAYLKTGLFIYAEPDYSGKIQGTEGNLVTPNDPFFSYQWSLYNDGHFFFGHVKTGADIHMRDAWAIEEGSSNTIIAVLDGGCKLDHPEFKDRFWINPKEIPNNGIDDDHDGYIDNLNGWDFVNNDNDPSDDNGHGTNVSEIIAANGNNGIGYAGIDWHARLIECKITDANGNGYYSWWIEALYYAVDHGARLVNMSVAGTDTSKALGDAIAYAGNHNVTVISCMGNSNGEYRNYPAAYPGVIAVGATNPDDSRCDSFFWSSPGNPGGSNYGSYISVVAPGNYIYGLNYQNDTAYYSYWGGTSQATPFVTGLASLLLAQNPNYTPKNIRRIIESTADDQVGKPSEDVKGWDKYYGYGRINAFRALSLHLAGIEDDNLNTIRLHLWPNPSSEGAKVAYTLRDEEQLTFSIYDISGRLLKQIHCGLQGTGEHILALDKPDMPGVYLVHIQGNKTSAGVLKMICY